MARKTGLLLDVSGIQSYIFGTNMLKQNVGASWIVSHVLEEDYLQKALPLQREQIVYQGGGNALLIFDNEEKAQDYSRLWSLKVLKDYPGVQPTAGIYTGEYPESETSNGFNLFLSACRENLKRSRSLDQVNTQIPRFGVTRECIYTGGSAQYYDDQLTSKAAGGLPKAYSHEVKIKYESYIPAERKLSKQFQDQLLDYSFTDNFETLAGTTNDDHRAAMAVIHIDGNDMGKRFSILQSLQRFKDISVEVSALFEQALATVIEKTVELLSRDQLILKNMGISAGILPVRPIILGGDDITYVCHASLGLWSAELFLTTLEALQGESESKITACAGIAFTKPSYPFDQGYEIAENLCDSAKQKRRQYLDELSDQSDLNRTKNDLSLLDFHIVQGGIFGDLDQVRSTGYSDESGLLIGRPFAIGKGQEGYHSLQSAATGIGEWPANKIKELREVAYKGNTEIDKFYQHCKKQNLEVPDLLKTRARQVLGNPKELDICEYLDQVPGWLRKQTEAMGTKK